MEAAAPQKRSRSVCLYLGANQMGKSWLMRQHYFAWKKKNPDGYVETIAKKDGYWLPGADLTPRGKKQPGWELLYPRILELTNNGLGPTRIGTNPRVGIEGGMLRLEDADAYLPPAVRGTPWQPVFLENAHCFLDVQANFHRPQPIDKNILGAAHHWYIFAMQEVHAYEYLMKLSNLQDSEVARKGLWPKRRGQYIHVINDPSHTGASRAEFFDDYMPELDQRTATG